MTAENRLLKHFLAGLAYRTNKAVSGAPESWATFQAEPGVRTPWQLVHHMTGVLAYAVSRFQTQDTRFEAELSFEKEMERFHVILRRLGEILDSNPEFNGTSPERLLQGPLADAMTHAGQLAMLRRLAGSPIPPRKFSCRRNIYRQFIQRPGSPGKPRFNVG